MIFLMIILNKIIRILTKITNKIFILICPLYYQKLQYHLFCHRYRCFIYINMCQKIEKKNKMILNRMMMKIK